jgi:hypothetical protein
MILSWGSQQQQLEVLLPLLLVLQSHLPLQQQTMQVQQQGSRRTLLGGA